MSLHYLILLTLFISPKGIVLFCKSVVNNNDIKIVELMRKTISVGEKETVQPQNKRWDKFYFMLNGFILVMSRGAFYFMKKTVL